MTHVQSIWTAIEVYPRLENLCDDTVEVLREWCERNSNSVPVELTSEQLILFLHSNYSDLESTKRCMEKYYSIRQKVPQFFENRDITHEELQESLKVLWYGIISERTPNRHKVLYHSLRDFDPTKYRFHTGFKMLTMAMDAIYIREGPNEGLVLLFDFKGVTLGHLARLPLTSVRRALEYIQEANPVRLKGIHVVNVHGVIDKLMMLIRPFLKKQFVSLLHFYKEGDESVYKYVPRDCFPSDYGGKQPSLKKLNELFVKEMEVMRPWFLEEEQYLADPTKRGNKKPAERDLDFSSLSID